MFLFTQLLTINPGRFIAMTSGSKGIAVVISGQVAKWAQLFHALNIGVMV